MPTLRASIKKADRLNRVDQSIRFRIELEIPEEFDQEFSEFQKLPWGQFVYLTTDDLNNKE